MGGVVLPLTFPDRCRHRCRVRRRLVRSRAASSDGDPPDRHNSLSRYQPVAREWYATMLADRHAPGDMAKARALFNEALAMYHSMGMPFHASRINGRLATL